jgi:rod shape-determining protein MreC
MRDFLKTKFFLVIVVAAVLAAAVPTALSALGAKQYLRSAVNVVLTPAQKGFHLVADALDGYASYFTRYDEIVAENLLLKQQIADLSDRLYNAEEAEVLNVWLSSFLEMKRAHTDFTFADAAITGRESVNYMTVCTVDRGSLMGIETGMTVVTPEGVLGCVSEVGPTWAKVRTLIESSSSIGAYIERTGELGLVEGEFALSSEGLCRITYLAADSDVRVGDRVLTSGYGSVYPRNLVVGYVTEIVPDEYSRTVTAVIRPAATLTGLARVMIITSYDVYHES